MVKNQYEGYEYIDPNHQYTYPNSTVLINKQNITNIEEAYRNEHLFVTYHYQKGILHKYEWNKMMKFTTFIWTELSMENYGN